ncbi:hypothetical protein DPMN_111947 [Dreissena polymorpha]|uniref:Uncharacterized protein n=1 Tax=Dreissena polymorpha TaxID=45954 RepID=A0A9D4KFH6_DREPO|nr:hypothetical protein DPMN_111947 [Dreissena polymorpha]
MADKQSLNSYKDRLEKKERKRYEEKISLIGGRDPYALSKGDLASDNKCLPSVIYIDIVNYKINNNSVYTFEHLKTYKSMEAINQLAGGWVRDVQSMTVNDNV